MDTSDWVAAYRAEVAANLLDLFRLVVPEAVIVEIMAGDPRFPTREYSYATFFRHLRDRMTVVPAADAPPPLAVFGSGEAAALAMAQQQGLLVLINEWRAAENATSLGLQVVTIPTLVVRLHVGEVISRRAAQRKLDLPTSITAAAYIDEARRLIDERGLPCASRRPRSVARPARPARHRTPHQPHPGASGRPRPYPPGVVNHPP